MADNAVRHFLPWVRQGAASGITTPDSLGAGSAPTWRCRSASELTDFERAGPRSPALRARGRHRHRSAADRARATPASDDQLRVELLSADRNSIVPIFRGCSRRTDPAGERLRPWIVWSWSSACRVTLGRRRRRRCRCSNSPVPWRRICPISTNRGPGARAGRGLVTDTVATLKGAIEMPRRGRCRGWSVRAGSTRMWPTSRVSFRV